MNENQFTETKVQEIDLIEIAHMLLRKWWLIGITAVIGAIAAILFTKFAVTPMYQSKAMLYVLPNTTSVTSVTDLQIGTAITGDFVIIATSKPTVDKAIDAIWAKEGVRMTRGQVQGMISVVNEEDTRILTLKATSDNPKYACMVANAMAEATAERMAEITKKDPPTTVEMAEVSSAPVSPSMQKNVAMGFIAGALLVCAILFVQYLVNDNIKTEEDIAKYLNEVTLASIPYVKNHDHKERELRRQKGEERAKG